MKRLRPAAACLLLLSCGGPDGAALVESYLVPRLGHGTPVDPGADEPERRCGASSAQFPDAGISSTYHIARAWGLTGGAFTTRAALPR